MTKYAAFLRGINIGGRKVGMQDLQQVFESLGFSNVKTFIASGNVIFESDDSDKASLVRVIEEKLKAQFGFDIVVMLRTIEELMTLMQANPFRDIVLTPKTKLYITFFADQKKETLPIPYKHPDKDFTIVYLSESEVCSVLVLAPGTGTPELMQFLEKQFGKNITTRNWNTIQKLLN